MEEFPPLFFSSYFYILVFLFVSIYLFVLFCFFAKEKTLLYNSWRVVQEPFLYEAQLPAITVQVVLVNAAAPFSRWGNQLFCVLCVSFFLLSPPPPPYFLQHYGLYTGIYFVLLYILLSLPIFLEILTDWFTWRKLSIGNVDVHSTETLSGMG